MSLSVRRRLRRRYLSDTCQMSRGPSPFPKSFLPDHLGFSVWNPFCAEYQSQKPHLLPPSSLSGPISLCVSSRYGSVGFIYSKRTKRSCRKSFSVPVRYSPPDSYLGSVPKPFFYTDCPHYASQAGADPAALSFCLHDDAAKFSLLLLPSSFCICPAEKIQLMKG